MTADEISVLIDQSPMNRGLVGAEWMANPDNVAVEAHGNVMLFQFHAPGIYEFHWLHTATSGKQAVRDTRAAIREMFQRGAHTLYGLTPADNVQARIMVRAIGAKIEGRFMTDDGPVILSTMTPENFERLH